ncbi:hypothetical protein [Paenibacillus macquariensis]|uniref:Bacteriophage SP-beta YorD domain-containing protein n=1 Tax=Paenibacillus macquariensis TaxID=948756 RepID=A0ABY1JSG1_9BACL|nr:hypothetical protein [Paenibacillus macquariensis]MEC0092924.1 hypothetical protein [Paenibacillus macquariensis]OAB36291.1 hypothetical protein PMSM_07540 [Paenibacillus macquariensis subsp. macquariensis]SIQ68847.1 hypothetical protein SAMN05421578_103379 [Paenibacillus macquariensis]
MPEKDEVKMTPIEPPLYTPPVTQYYADFNESGNITGFYVNTIHGENIPEAALPITIEEWQLYSSNSYLYKFDGEAIREKTPEEIAGEYVEPEPIPKTEDQLRIELLEQENTLLTAQNQAISERADFIDEVIAEMAMMVYR